MSKTITKLQAAAKILGSMGGSKKSEAKTAAARQNGLKPCAPGKKRGRPFGWRKSGGGK